jgi:adenylate cyclase
VLFADLVGFTAMSEKLPAERVVEILNGYFKVASRAIADHNGHLTKFMGDGLMAIFGAPDPNPWQAMDAVRAGLAVLSALDAYNAELATVGHPPLRACIGIHGGSVVAGVIGSSALVEYTVIGDVVNTASRIEGLTRRFGTNLLVSDAIRASLDERFEVREMPPVEVKGKSEELVTYAVERFNGAA